MAVGLPLKTTYANGDVYSASDVNDTNGTVNLFQTSTLSSSAGKNVIINGGLDIWQRGTSSASSGVYLADRWYQIAAGTTTISRDTDVPSGVPVQYAIKWVTSASSSFGQFFQMIEEANVIPLRSQVMTASLYVKTSGSYSGNLVLKIEYNTTSDTYSGGSWVLLNEVAFAGSSVTSWTRKTNTFTVPSNAVGIRYSLLPDAVQASGVNVFMTGAQVERGSYATTFSRAGSNLGGELALCQRYYYRQNAQGTYNYFGLGFADQTTTALIGLTLPSTMRATPTVLDFSTLNLSTGATNFTVTSMTITGIQSGLNTVCLYPVVASGLTVNRPYALTSNASTSGYVGVGAEL
jgi:hypothetical protein